VSELKTDPTATCCRGCISKWHGIEKGRALNEAEVDYIVALLKVAWDIVEARLLRAA